MKKIIDFFICLFKGEKKKDITPIVYEHHIPTDFDVNLFVAINTFRINKGLSTLRLLSDVSDIAASHTKWLSEQELITLEDFKRKGHFYSQQRFEQIQLLYPGVIHIGENVGFNYRMAESYVRAWENSPGHCEIMSGDFNAIGISSNEHFADTLYVKL